MKKKIKKNIKGFSLIEVIVSLLIISFIIVGVYSLIIISLKLNSDNAFYIEAIEIANQKMEQIRNLPYNDVGITTGFPSGVISQYETISKSGTYEVHTSIIYHDDPYDGLAGEGDLVFADYKIVTINVSWQGKFQPRKVTVFSKVIAATEETHTGYGLLRLYIVDSNGSPVPSPKILIENSSLGISMNLTGNALGELSVPLPPSFEGYEVTVTKTGFSSDKTYNRDGINPNPTKPFLSIFDGLKTEESFSIDKLSMLQVETLQNTLPINWSVNEISTSTISSNHSVGTDSDNNFYVAWQNNSLATSSIKIQKFNSSYSKIWSNEKTISNTNFQVNPDISTLPNGNSLIVWTDNSSSLKSMTFKDNIKKPPYQFASTFLIFDLNNNSYFKNHFSTPQIISNKKSDISFPLFTKEVLASTYNILFVGAGPGSIDNSRFITLSVPSDVQKNDLLIAIIHHDDSSDGPMLPPIGGGWNLLADDLDPSGLSSDSNGTIFWKFAQEFEPSNHIFRLDKNNNEEKVGHIRAYRNVRLSSPFDGGISTLSNSRNNRYHNAPSKNISSNGSMLVCGWGTDSISLGNALGGPNYPPGMNNPVNNHANNISSISVDMPVDLSNSPTGIKTLDAKQNVSTASIGWCLVLAPETITDYVIISSINNQTSEILSPSSNSYIGGAFVFTSTFGEKTITDIVITENGSIDAYASINGLKLFYDIDTSEPYDCNDDQYNEGLDSQFGSLENFDSPNGRASFNEALGITINPAQTLCLYPVIDISSAANSGDSINLSIKNPSSDITIDSGTISPSTEVSLNGSTNIIKPAILEQIHYRFRNDDGNEENATWIDSQNVLSKATISENIRLRIAINNDGDMTSDPIEYKLEYAENTSSCDFLTTWTALPNDSSSHWKMNDSSYFSDNSTSTNISDGLSDENINFKYGYLKKTESATPPLSLNHDQFTELEFSIMPTENANDSNYCFRLTNNGSILNFQYKVYPEISIVGDNNIYIIGINSDGNEIWSTKKVNSDSGNADQKIPKIASTNSFSTATSVIAWEDKRDGDYNIYAQLFDHLGNKLWPSDLKITSSSTDENSISLKFDNDNNFIISWIGIYNGINKIFLNKFDLDGIPLWPTEILLNSASTKFEYSPDISTDSDNNIYIAYHEDDLGILNSKIIKLNPTGNQLWSEYINLSASSFHQISPSISFSDSAIMASWTDLREGNSDIYYQKIDLFGNKIWPNDQKLNVNNEPSNQSNSINISNSLNKTIAVWNDNRDNEYNVYASELIPPQTNISYPNVPLVITGTKKIGENPIIYKVNEYLYTNSAGILDLLVEWDSGYTININPASSSLKILKTLPATPVGLDADSIKKIFIYAE